METVYDAVIVGAGPAGGQCARELAQQGKKVLLIDKAQDVWENNYSSGGAPLAILNDFQLPDSLAGTYWNTLRIQSTKAQSSWTAPSPLGPILDFDKLRTFLVQETEQAGGICYFGCLYQSHEIHAQGAQIKLKNTQTAEIFTVQSKVLVDATGSERKVLAQSTYNKTQAIVATGIEYHVQVEPLVYAQYAHALNFFLGHHWMPQGYAWIFPMANSQLKIGVIRYFQNKVYVPHAPSYHFYLQQLLDLCGPHTVHDKHGKTIYYTKKQKDLRSQGPVLALGDAISSVNPLGWEGIRHALVSGRQAAQTIESYLNKQVPNLKGYDQAMHRYFGRKWIYSEWLMNSLFKTKQDALIDYSVKAFGKMNQEEILKVVFDYQFHHTLKSYFSYFISRARSLFR